MQHFQDYYEERENEFNRHPFHVDKESNIVDYCPARWGV